MKKLLAILFVVFLNSSNSLAHTPEYTEVYYDASKNIMNVWVRHRTTDGKKHRISKFEVLYDGLKFELLSDEQNRWEYYTPIPLGNAKPPKNTIVTIRLTCSLSGTIEHRYQF